MIESLSDGARLWHGAGADHDAELAGWLAATRATAWAAARQAPSGPGRAWPSPARNSESAARRRHIEYFAIDVARLAGDAVLIGGAPRVHALGRWLALLERSSGAPLTWEVLDTLAARGRQALAEGGARPHGTRLGR